MSIILAQLIRAALAIYEWAEMVAIWLFVIVAVDWGKLEELREEI